MTVLILVAVGSFALGVCIGVTFDDAWDLYRQSRKDRRMTATSNGSRRLLGWTIIAIAVVQVFVGIGLIKSRLDLAAAERDRASYETCTSRWQQEFASAYKARIASSTDAANALEQVVRAVGAEDPDRFRDAVHDYLVLRDAQIRDQKSNPYPPLPDELCGDRP